MTTFSGWTPPVLKSGSGYGSNTKETKVLGNHDIKFCDLLFRYIVYLLQSIKSSRTHKSRNNFLNTILLTPIEIF